MKTKTFFLALSLIIAPFVSVFADDGATIFKTTCAACHSIGKGKLVGPDLKGVNTRHTEAWLEKWIKSSQTLVNSGDKDAKQLFADNNQIVMPDQALSDNDIKGILDYIKAGGDAPVSLDANKASEKKGPDAITVATQKAAQAKEEEGGSLLTEFSFTEYMLMFLMGISLIVIYILGLTVKSLTERLKAGKETTITA